MSKGEWTTALAAVRAAGQLARAVQERIGLLQSLVKEDRSPVTVADYGVQAVVNHFLAAAFPDDPVMAEEETRTLRLEESAPLRMAVCRAVQQVLPDLMPERILELIDRGSHPGGGRGRFWTLDPVDGTLGFLRGDQFAIALALIEDGKPVLGVLGCPQLPTDRLGGLGQRGVLFAAARGRTPVAVGLEGGDELRLAVSAESDPRRAVFCESFEPSHSSHDLSARVAARLGVTAPPLRVDSQVKYGLVARGEAGVYLRLPTRAAYREKVWDHAAGSLIVRAAGGKVTDVHGRPLDFSCGRRLEVNEGVVASNGPLHPALLEAVAVVMAS